MKSHFKYAIFNAEIALIFLGKGMMEIISYVSKYSTNIMHYLIRKCKCGHVESEYFPAACHRHNARGSFDRQELWTQYSSGGKR